MKTEGVEVRDAVLEEQQGYFFLKMCQGRYIIRLLNQVSKKHQKYQKLSREAQSEQVCLEDKKLDEFYPWRYEAEKVDSQETASRCRETARRCRGLSRFSQVPEGNSRLDKSMKQISDKVEI